MTEPVRPRINPLSRRPRQQRLVIAVRGAAGVGKSYFARSLKDAGLGRLMIFDTERKTRLLKGVTVEFDGIEIEHPDDLPEFISWLLDTEEGRAQNIGALALDSWAAYFSAKHAETIRAVRARTGDPLAQPSAEELAADQMVLQGVLRRLCIESGRSVVIVDQIPAKGKESKEDNEVGRVLPITSSGLEFFCDLMLEVSLQERDGEIVRVFQVVKSNTEAFEIGQEFTGEVTFKHFLDHLQRETGAPLPAEKPIRPTAPETLPPPPAPHAAPTVTIAGLYAKADAHGISRATINRAAKTAFNQDNPYHLTTAQLTAIDERLDRAIRDGAAAKKAAKPAGKPAAGSTKAAAAEAALAS